ncbi:uncharacterized protein LOC117325546 [Pecten maximus]|uniref:uncharacterized protein LOC117325546 n=1 Tax=Pecten maximus TaxID=6579 RepID=UPI001458B207|nr:uncharacterized protein LOC117325546 [Pecten maximus]XP_033737744.1 uncharacterized protein LOC117325546 [Pecten maximus]
MEQDKMATDESHMAAKESRKRKGYESDMDPQSSSTEMSTSSDENTEADESDPPIKRQTKMTDFIELHRSSKQSSSYSDMTETPTGADESVSEVKMSFYKLRWYTLKDHKIKDVRMVIESNFEPQKSGKMELAYEKQINDFHVVAYQRETKRPARKLLPSAKQKKNITHACLIFFFTEAINPKHAFCLCSGHSHSLLKGHIESSFVKLIAVHFMDGMDIHDEKCVCIAGPNIEEERTFSREMKHTLCNDLERITIGLTAQIREGTELAVLVCDGQSVSMKFGLQHLKINKMLSLDTFSKVFKLFIEVCQNRDSFSKDKLLERTLNQKQYIGIPDKIRELEKQLMKNVCEDNGQLNAYLSYKYVRDWVNSSDIELKRGEEILHRWTSAPTFSDVNTKCRLSDDKIRIAFTNNEQTKVEGKLEVFIHGSTEHENEKYYKVAGKWYLLSSRYRSLLMTEMASFLETSLIQEEETGYLPLTWNPRSSPGIPTMFRFLSNLKPDQLSKLLRDQEVHYVSQDGKSCLRNLNCKFIESTRVFNDIKQCLQTPKTKRTKKETKEGLMPNKKRADKEDKKERLNVLKMISGLEHAMMVSEENDRPIRDCIQSCSLNKEGKENLKDYIEEIIGILQKPRFVINSDDKVEHPNVTIHLSQTVCDLINSDQTMNCTPEIVGEELTCYLRSSCEKIAEADYNETYQSIPAKDDLQFYMVGDRVQAPKSLPELFDVLYYKGKDSEEHAKLYLYHVKEGFGQETRAACSQIRVSANQLWNDLMDSKNTLPAVKKLRELAVGYKGDEIARIMLKNAVQYMTEDSFKEMFKKAKEIVYVYAFMDTGKKDNFLNKLPGMVKDIKEIISTPEMLRELENKNYVHKDGTLEDEFFLDTLETFIKRMNADKKFRSQHLKNLHKQIKGQLQLTPSLIAQIELTSLAKEFARFQCSARRFSLKVCQISTCYT